MPDTTDPAASARKRLDGLDAIRLRRHSMAEESVNLKLHAVTEDFRRLLAAVEAALAFHVEAVIEDVQPEPFRYCRTCSGHPAWPCPEVAAVRAELLREAGDAGT